MTRVYYSNLPPEAQQAIQKLTGSTAEQLENIESGKLPTPTAKRRKAKPKTLKQIYWRAFLSSFKRRGRSFR